MSQAFEGCLDTGMTLMWMYPDYSLDPISGDLFDDCVSYNNFLDRSVFPQAGLKRTVTECGGPPMDGQKQGC